MKRRNGKQARLLITGVGLLALCGLAGTVLGACGSSGSSSDGGATAATAPSGGYFTKASLEKRMKALYASSFTAPPKTSPPPKPGTNITMITASLSFSAGADAANGVQEAGEAMGWNVRVVDGKFDTNTELTAIRQAIVNGADGIILYLIDCPAVQSGLEQAKQAGIPVVGVEAFDCNDIKSGGEDLMYGVGDYNSAPYGPPQEYAEGWINDWSKVNADAIIAATNMQAKVIEAVETDSEGTLHIHTGYQEEMAKCAECETVAEIEYTGAEFGPVLQQKIAQAIIQHPEANAVFGGYDAPVASGGIAAAVRASGRVGDLYVTGGEGHAENVALVHEHKGQNAGSGTLVTWEAWAGTDAMNRVLNGGEPAPTGMGLQLWDEGNNLPPLGHAWDPNVDFRALYKEAWGV